MHKEIKTDKQKNKQINKRTKKTQEGKNREVVNNRTNEQTNKHTYMNKRAKGFKHPLKICRNYCYIDHCLVCCRGLQTNSQFEMCKVKICVAKFKIAIYML